MAQVKIYCFTVVGSGSFPLDMLRYDACHPVSSTDAEKIGMQSNEGERFFKRRSIELAGIRKPTEARWKSFLWTVDKSTSVKVPQS